MVKINIFIKRAGSRKFELYKTIAVANEADAPQAGTAGIYEAVKIAGGKDAYWDFAK